MSTGAKSTQSNDDLTVPRDELHFIILQLFDGCSMMSSINQNSVAIVFIRHIDITTTVKY
jgi:hypothetical protein